MTEEKRRDLEFQDLQRTLDNTSNHQMTLGTQTLGFQSLGFGAAYTVWDKPVLPVLCLILFGITFILWVMKTRNSALAIQCREILNTKFNVPNLPQDGWQGVGETMWHTVFVLSLSMWAFGFFVSFWANLPTFHRLFGGC